MNEKQEHRRKCLQLIKTWEPENVFLAIELNKSQELRIDEEYLDFIMRSKVVQVESDKLKIAYHPIYWLLCVHKVYRFKCWPIGYNNMSDEDLLDFADMCYFYLGDKHKIEIIFPDENRYSVSDKIMYKYKDKQSGKLIIDVICIPIV